MKGTSEEQAKKILNQEYYKSEKVIKIAALVTVVNILVTLSISLLVG